MSRLFITFEGIDGTGKSTHMAWLADYLEQQGVQLVRTREPGGTAIAESIRQVVLHDSADEKIDAAVEAMLMYAARVQHVEQRIKPALAAGQWVLSDRFYDATFAYQGDGRGVTPVRLQALHEWCLGDFKPDFTVLFDAPVDVCMARIADKKPDRLEQEQHAFFERVRAAYLERAQAEPERFAVMDASQPIEAVQAMLKQWADQCLL